MRIHPFQGKNNPDVYLEWEKKGRVSVCCHEYFEEKKVKLVAVEFTYYIVIWWDHLVLNRNRGRLIDTQEEMKTII